MIRTEEFYENNYSIRREELKCIADTIEQIENGIVNGKALRRLGLNGLIYCVCEGKIDTLKKLIGPIGIKKEDGKVEYKYYMDAISLGFLEYINGVPSSIMERFANLYRQEMEEAKSYANDELVKAFDLFEDREAMNNVLLRRAAKDVVILSKEDKAAIRKVLLDINMGIVGKIKIKDVHARQISGMGHPIRSREDVAYYSEISNYLPSLALYNMNIATTSNDTMGCIDDINTDECQCEISIHYGSLSEENKCVADAIVESGNGRFIRSFVDDGKDLMITVPCEGNETILDVNKRFMKLIAKFTKQDVLHGVVSKESVLHSLKIWNDYGMAGENQAKVRELLSGDITSLDIVEALKYFEGILDYVYDQDEDKFYADPVVYAKHKEYLVESSMNNGDGSVTI